MAWILSNIELLIKVALTVLIFIPFIKNWKACEIKHHQHNLDLQYDVLRENEKRAKEFYETQCKIDPNLLANDMTREAEIKSYNISVNDYNKQFFEPIRKQNEEIKQLQDSVFNLRKNEWKSLWPFLASMALMWLGIKF